MGKERKLGRTGRGEEEEEERRGRDLYDTSKAIKKIRRSTLTVPLTFSDLYPNT